MLIGTSAVMWCSSVCGISAAGEAAGAAEEDRWDDDDERPRAGVPVKERLGVRRRTSIGARSRGMPIGTGTSDIDTTDNGNNRRQKYLINHDIV